VHPPSGRGKEGVGKRPVIFMETRQRIVGQEKGKVQPSRRNERKTRGTFVWHRKRGKNSRKKEKKKKVEPPKNRRKLPMKKGRAYIHPHSFSTVFRRGKKELLFPFRWGREFPLSLSRKKGRRGFCRRKEKDINPSTRPGVWGGKKKKKKKNASLSPTEGNPYKKRRKKNEGPSITGLTQKKKKGKGKARAPRLLVMRASRKEGEMVPGKKIRS